jgi:small subunit ribosomal protein S17
MVQETARVVNRKSRTGTVVSDVNDKTIIVEIVRQAPHRLYRKVIRRTKRYHVHDPENQATVGDIVRIEECRPISKTKRWQLSAVLTERQVADVAPETLDEGLIEEIQGLGTEDESTEAIDETPAAEATSVDEPAADAEADAPADAAEEKAD